MKKTISINLAGLVFNIEEQGYEQLKQYLEAIRRIFSKESGVSEIMEDIESRIAELFHERLGKLKQVITESDIEDVIQIMGQPNEYAVDGESELETEFTGNDESKKVFESFRQKRLYRDEDRASVAGVCAGLGHYFNLDPVIFRLLFVLMVILGGSGILIYIILVLVVPEAKTTAEKLQMRGEPVNIESIKEHVTNFTEDAKKGVNKASQNIRGAMTKGYSVLQKMFSIFAKVIGVGFVVGGFIGIVVLVGMFFGDFKLFPFYAENTSNNLYGFLALVFESDHFSFVFLSLFFVVIIPLISLFLFGLRLLFDWKYKMKRFHIGAFAFWILCIIVLTFYSIETGLNFKEERQVSQLINLENEDIGDTLLIDAFSSFLQMSHLGDEPSDYLRIDKDSIYLSAITISLIKDVSIDEFEISLQKMSNGPTGKVAYEKAQRIYYTCSIEKNTLYLPSFYTFPLADQFRNQHVTIEIRVPENKYVVIKNFDDDLPYDIHTKSMHRVEMESKDRVWETRGGTIESTSSTSIQDSTVIID